jgi:predicted PurR-regulated permease PerM
VNASREDPRALIRYALAAAALTVMVVWAMYLAREVLLLIYVAALVAIGLSPLVGSIEHRGNALTGNRVPRGVAILAIYLLVIGALVGIGMLVVPPLAEQTRELWRDGPRLIHQGQQWLIDRGVLGREITVREAVEQAPVGSGDVVGTVFGAVWGFVGGIFGVVTILILAFYFLLDAEQIIASLIRLAPRSERARVDAACRRVTTKVSAWLGGQLLLAAIIGGSAAIALWLMGVPYFFVLALISAVGEMIPIVGPLLAAIPAIGVAFSVSPALALGVAIFFLAQQQFENHVLVPKVMERQVGVSAVMVIVALLIGGSLLGILGAILAVPSAAILHVLYEETTDRDLSSPSA